MDSNQTKNDLVKNVTDFIYCLFRKYNRLFNLVELRNLTKVIDYGGGHVDSKSSFCAPLNRQKNILLID